MASAVTKSLAFGFHVVSRLPSAFKRAMLLRTMPFTWVNEPPITTLPSDCTAVASTTPRSKTCAIAGLRTPCPPPLGGASCTAWPLFTSTRSGAVSTASKLEPAIERN